MAFFLSEASRPYHVILPSYEYRARNGFFLRRTKRSIDRAPRLSTLSSCLFILGPCKPYCNEGKPSLFLEEDNRWPGNNPGSQRLGQVTAVDTDSQGNVLVFHRASRIWQAE